MKTVEVSGAILLRDGKVLCAQRGISKQEYISKKYEFPGGKIEDKETPKEALRRELIEEMDVDIPTEEMEAFIVVEHQYPDFSIRMHCFICNVKDDKVTLKEHLGIRWENMCTIKELDWAPADIPVVDALVMRGF